MGIRFQEATTVHALALQLRAQRTRVLASNLANESTPGYQARDIDFKAAMQNALGSAPMTATTPGTVAQPAPAAQVLYRLPSQTSKDGNTVELGVEQAEFAQNALDFQTSLTFLNMKLKGLAAAISGQT